MLRGEWECECTLIFAWGLWAFIEMLLAVVLIITGGLWLWLVDTCYLDPVLTRLFGLATMLVWGGCTVWDYML